MSGYLASRYWLRWTKDATDQDLYETLALDVGDPEQDAVSAHFLGRLTADLDGRDTGSSEFFGLMDTYDDHVHGQIYDAHLDLHRVPGLVLVRVGRQLSFETPELVYFDGLLAETSAIGAAQLRFGAYGGASTHQYESSPEGDWTAGIYAQVRPWHGGRLRLDWMHLEDETRLGAHADDLVSAGIWQTIAGGLQLETQYSRIEDRDRDIRARVGYTAADFTAQATYYQLLTTQRDLVLELDPFFNSLLEYFPYAQAGVQASKTWCEHWELQAGADVRRVADAADVGVFNRDYERYYGVAGVRDLPLPGLALNVTADWWSSNGQDVRSWGVEASHASGKRWTTSLGTYYSLYKFDLFLQRESDHVRTYFGALRYEATKGLDFDLRYEFEDVDFGDFQYLRVGATWRF